MLGCIISLSAQKKEIWEQHSLPPGYRLATNIHGIAFDHSGTKWLATMANGAGAWKYDETNWIQFAAPEHDHDEEDEHGEECDALGLAADHSSCVTVDHRNNIWFGSVGHGVSRLSDTTWNVYNRKNYLASDIIRDILTIRDTVWIATKGGLSRLIGDTNWKTYLKADGLTDTSITCLATDLSGNLWVGTAKGISKFNGVYWSPHYPITSISDNYIDALTVDSKNNIWAAIYQSGIWMYDGESWMKQYDEHTSFNSLVFDKKGHLWAGSSYSGVWRFDGSSWAQYTTDDGLLDNKTESIAVDNQGNVWIGCFGGLTKVYEINDNTYISNNEIEENLISVYPNPASTQAVISNVDNAIIHLYAISGQRIKTYHSQDKDITIDIADLKQGIYCLTIEKDNAVILRRISVIH